MKRTQMLHGSIAIDEQYPGSAFGTGIRKRPSMNFVLVSPSYTRASTCSSPVYRNPLSIFCDWAKALFKRK